MTMAPEKVSDLELQNGDVLQQLPPLPEPDHAALRTQTAVGCGMVLGLSGTFVSLTFVAATFFPELPQTARWIYPPLICIEAVIAVISLLGLVFDDPGVIRRCPEFSLPLPRQIEEKMREGIPLERLDVLQNVPGDDGRTYCVRCFVWRQKFSHHCRTCGRCVRDFDHHCGVFGRCIAGRRLHGNLKYFLLVIAMGWSGALTCGSCVIWAVTLRWGYWAVPYLFLGYIAVACTMVGLSSLYMLVCNIIERCNSYKKVATEDPVEAVKYGARDA